MFYFVPKYTTEEEFKTTVSESMTIFEVINKFVPMARAQGYYYRMFHNTCEKYNVSTEHFNQYHKNKEIGEQRRKHSNEYVFQDFSDTKRAPNSNLKTRMLEVGFKEICSLCAMEPLWQNQPITLQIDHIDGNPLNNKKENLRFLCPNCHSQTPTFGGKNQKKNVLQNTVKENPVTFCCVCNAPKTFHAFYCQPCSEALKYKINWDNTALEKMIKVDQLPFTTIGKRLGVSDNAVRKHAMKLGIIPPKKKAIMETLKPQNI